MLDILLYKDNDWVSVIIIQFSSALLSLAFTPESRCIFGGMLLLFFKYGLGVLSVSVQCSNICHLFHYQNLIRSIVDISVSNHFFKLKFHHIWPCFVYFCRVQTHFHARRKRIGKTKTLFKRR